MRLLAALLAIASGACASFTNLQRAEVLGEGETRVGFAPAVMQVSNGPSTEGTYPMIITARHGLGGHADIGMRAWFNGGAVGGKWQFLDTEHFVGSLAPEFLAFETDLDVATEFQLPLLFGARVGGQELIFGVRGQWRRWQTSFRDTVPLTAAFFPAAILGIDFAYWRVHVMPEGTLAYWPAADRYFGTLALAFQFDLGER